MEVTERKIKKDNSFNHIRNHIVKKCKDENACSEEFAKLIRAKTFNELFEVLSQNSSWVYDHKILCQITELPEGLSVGGSLYLRGTQITELPEGLSVGGYLDLRGTQITELPEGLSAGGSLYLEGTQITELPEGLSVGGYLYLRGTQITELPEGLKKKVIR